MQLKLRMLERLWQEKTDKARAFRSSVELEEAKSWARHPMTIALIATLEARLLHYNNKWQSGDVVRETFEDTALSLAQLQAESGLVEDVIQLIEGLVNDDSDEESLGASGTQASGET